MREYFILESKNKLLFIFILFSLLIIGCHPGYIVPGEVNVFSKSPIVHPACANLVIFPFNTSENSPDLSLNVAKLFNQKISRNNYTNKITLKTKPYSPIWNWKNCKFKERFIFQTIKKLT